MSFTLIIKRLACRMRRQLSDAHAPMSTRRFAASATATACAAAFASGGLIVAGTLLLASVGPCAMPA